MKGNDVLARMAAIEGQPSAVSGDSSGGAAGVFAGTVAGIDSIKIGVPSMQEAFEATGGGIIEAGPLGYLVKLFKVGNIFPEIAPAGLMAASPIDKVGLFASLSATVTPIVGLPKADAQKK